MTYSGLMHCKIDQTYSEWSRFNHGYKELAWSAPKQNVHKQKEHMYLLTVCFEIQVCELQHLQVFSIS